MPQATLAPETDASGNPVAGGDDCNTLRVVLAPAAISPRLKKEKEERENEAPGLEGGRGLWPTNIAICIKRSPYFSCCLVRWTASFPLQLASAALFLRTVLPTRSSAPAKIST
jgi:hypothetical protein